MKVAIVYTGKNQDPLVRCALANDHNVVLLTFGNPDIITRLCKVYCVSSMSMDEIVSICKYEKIDGICSVASELAVIPMAEICESMRLPGISLQLAKLCTNKLSIKKVFMRLAVNTPEYDVAFFSNCGEIVDKCMKIGFPVIFKPVDSCNSKGITVISRKEQISYGLNNVKNYTHKDRFIIERFVCGDSFGVEVWVNQRKIVFALPVGNYSEIVEGVDIPKGHYAPYFELTDDERSRVIQDVTKIIDETGRHDGHYTIDCRRDHSGCFYFLEMGARCGGNMLPELLSQYYGIDIYQTIISQALGESIAVGDLKQQPCAAGYAAKKSNNKSDPFIVQADTEHEAYLLGKYLAM